VKLGIERGSYAIVEASDIGHERLTIRTSAGAAIVYALERLRGVEVFRPESRTLAVGDRIQFRTPDRALKVANGEFATVAAISSEQTRVRMDDGREISAATPRLRHVDYGYASTSHSSQGATVDRVIVNIDTTRSVKLVNQRQFYVSISRARHDARIYTDDAQALARAVGREQLNRA
jgi:ATP-dependent exoDNAse (exonuclease V) alpha subunit